MTEEERKEQTKKIYSLKMWDCCMVKDTYNQTIIYTRVPSGFLVDKGANTLFIPMNKKEECTCNNNHKINI